MRKSVSAFVVVVLSVWSLGAQQAPPAAVANALEEIDKPAGLFEACAAPNRNWA